MRKKRIFLVLNIQLFELFSSSLSVFSNSSPIIYIYSCKCRHVLSVFLFISDSSGPMPQCFLFALSFHSQPPASCTRWPILAEPGSPGAFSLLTGSGSFSLLPHACSCGESAAVINSMQSAFF